MATRWWHAWQAKLKHEQEVKALQAKANEGDADAMFKLGFLHTTAVELGL